MFGKKKKKIKNKKTLLIVCASVGLVAVGTSILFYALKRSK